MMMAIDRGRVRGDKSKRALSEQRAAEFAHLIISFDDMMIKKSGESGLTPQGRLLMGLLIHGSMTIKEALMYTPLSYRAFYNMLDKLKRLSFITVETVPGDRRIRQLTLERKFSPILKMLAAMMETIPDKSGD